MRLYHVTPSYNVPSIRREGILLRYAQREPACLWFCQRGWVEWAMAHVRRRHNCEAVAVLMARVNNSCLRKSFAGLWVSSKDLAAKDLRGLLAIDGATIC